MSTLFSDIFLSYLFDSISLYFTFTLSIPVIVQLPINCKHATVLAYHDVLSLHLKKYCWWKPKLYCTPEEGQDSQNVE